MESGVERKLTAILAADVVGYSRLMGDDHEATLKTLTAYRELFASNIRQHKGRVVNAPGDSILAEFASAVDAVAGAVAIQRELAERNDELPSHRRMEFRIGVNVGDVLVQDEALYGDGVNIAARLEGLAEAGGICISRMAYDNVKGRLPLEYEYLGEHEVKNIAEPVRTYRVLSIPGAAAHRVTAARKSAFKTGRAVGLALSAAVVIALVGAGFYFFGPGSAPEPDSESAALTDKRSIAVLPFDNLSDDSAATYFSDGITEDIITDLSQYDDLAVVARNSVFKYRGKSPDVRDVARDLNVRYILEGSVRIDDRSNTVRITAQLVDGTTGIHLWAERYDRPLDDVLAIQEEISDRIFVALDVALIQGEQAISRRKSTTSIEAYKLFRKANALYHEFTPVPNAKSRQLAEQAVRIDPKFAAGWMQIGWCYSSDYEFFGMSTDEVLAKAWNNAQKALELDPNQVEAHMLVAHIHHYRDEIAAGLESAQTAVDVGPTNADAVGYLGYHLAAAGRPEEAVVVFKKAIAMAPIPENWMYAYLGKTYLFQGKYDPAMEQIGKAIDMTPGWYLPHLFLAAVFAEDGRVDDATRELADVLDLYPTFSCSSLPEAVTHWGFKPYMDRLCSSGLLQ